MPRPNELPAWRDLKPWTWDPPRPPAVLAWREVFGNDRPVELEIGCGKGQFLVEAALARPEVNFLGLELRFAHALYIGDRLARRALHNARIAYQDAHAFLQEIVPRASVAAIHLYFPDPWWKRKHHKRRLVTPTFTTLCGRALGPEGRIYLATDAPEYFAMARGLYGNTRGLRECPQEPRDPAAPKSNFERKALSNGTEIFRATFLATGEPTLAAASGRALETPQGMTKS